MDSSPVTFACPVCETIIQEGTPYCPGCGLAKPEPQIDAMGRITRVGVDNFSFPYSEQSNAYQPIQIPQQHSPKATLRMLAYGLVAAILGGPILYLGHWLFTQLLAGATRQSNVLICMATIAVPILLVLSTGAAGYGLFSAVKNAAVKENSTDAGALKTITLVVSLAGIVAYYTTQNAILGRGEMWDSWVDYLRAILVVGGFLLAPRIWGKSPAQEIPLCEKCHAYMKSFNFGKPGMSGWPIGRERILMDLLNARRFDRIKELGTSFIPQNYSTATFWHCPKCKEDGYLNAETTQTRRKRDAKGNFYKDQQGTYTMEAQKRRIFSTKLQPEEIAVLLDQSILFQPAKKGAKA